METTRYLKLPLYFGPDPLIQDLESLREELWTAHFNKRDYDGQWTCISLVGPSDNAESIQVPHRNDVVGSPSKYLKLLTAYNEVFQKIEAPIIAARLMNLRPGSIIKPHTDYHMGYEDGVARIHIPILTHEEVEFIIDGTHLNMLAGECWYTNVNFTHSVHNFGSSDRIHLVIDCRRNEWLDNLFFSLVPKESLLSVMTPSYDQATIQRMISELRHSNAPAAQGLIEKLERQLNDINN